ncbi:MAG: acetyl-CoA carboxylase biotin carboxyl carrier protein [Gammaproteobacteria bacterium]|jgi:acetyl-CoA carboxylase biotin carboxyl carrier protein|tara:strand:- start:3213 stop:3647 length:435 start_codon:yes stop_codon:yes gene_type:complete
MDIRKIKTLIEMLEESNLNEIEVSQGEESVRISKSSNQNNFVNNAPLNNDTNINSSSNEVKDNHELRGNLVTSPIVGTFYRKPSPDKEPFVKVGDIVNKGDVLCIIEAMKMMNEIKSDFDGKVLSIEVDDAQPVEFGQTIIVIE